MRQSRRGFLGFIATVVTAMFVPARLALGMPAVAATGGLTIADIIAVSFLPVLTSMRDGRNWVSDILNAAEDDGRLIHMALAAQMHVNGVKYDVKELSVPTTWSKTDEQKNPLPEDKIALTQALIENTVNAHEYLLEEMLEGHNLIVSKQYRVDRTDVLTLPVEGDTAQYFLTYTAVLAVPKAVDLRTALIEETV